MKEEIIERFTQLESKSTLDVMSFVAEEVQSLTKYWVSSMEGLLTNQKSGHKQQLSLSTLNGMNLSYNTKPFITASCSEEVQDEGTMIERRSNEIPSQYFRQMDSRSKTTL